MTCPARVARRVAAAAFLAGAGTTVAADPAPLVPLPGRIGYAFDAPDVLVRQRLFGLAHGVNLLVSACLGRPAHAQATQAAYDRWQGAQHAAIAPLKNALATQYFGLRAGEAQWQDVAAALGLKETIHPSLGGTSLDDACASLPAALQNPRYDIAAHLAALVADAKTP